MVSIHYTEWDKHAFVADNFLYTLVAATLLFIQFLLLTAIKLAKESKNIDDRVNSRFEKEKMR